MLNPPEVLKTERLRICRLRLSDADRLFEGWAQDPRVTRYLIWKPHKTIEESIAHATRCEEAWENGKRYTWILQDPESEEALGSISAHPAGHRVGLGYLLKPSAWGKGLMTEAVSKLSRWFLEQPDIHRVWAVCDFENAGSARVLERAGFEFEGLLRRWEVHPNVGQEPRDALCFSIIRG